MAAIAVAALLTAGPIGHALALAVADEPSPVPAMYVLAPCDGVFYAGAYFGAEPFVTVGSTVSRETLVGTIEGMRTLEVRAGIDGTVVELLVADSQMVANGQPLMKIQPPNAAR
jgi:acetyl-CoA carboxylase biotin carboxyl carrier protein